jgi:Rrf2 family nitric oxide-sensitive transcriptional repressor
LPPSLSRSQFSNFSIRILMYAALRPSAPISAPEMSRAYGVSYEHLRKAAAALCRLGYLETVRGRSGGLRLAQSPDSIRIGSVIRATEGAVILVECFDPETNTCQLAPACRLRLVLSEALDAFFAVLDRYTLADLVAAPEELLPLLRLAPGGAEERAIVECGQSSREMTKETPDNNRIDFSTL